MRAQKQKKWRNEKVDLARKAFAVWVIGILVALILWGFNLLLTTAGVSLSLTSFAGVFTYFVVYAIFVGLVVHCVDEMIKEGQIDWMGPPLKTAGELWLIGLAVTAIWAVVSSLLGIFGLTVGFTTTIAIISTLLIYPLILGFVATSVDTWLTGD